MKNRLFFPQMLLDSWHLKDRVDFHADEIIFRTLDIRYRMIEAMLIVKEDSGEVDPFDLIGKVKSKAFLIELGAEIFENSMLIGSNAYSVTPGFVATSSVPFDQLQKEKELVAKFPNEEALISTLAQENQIQ